MPPGLRDESHRLRNQIEEHLHHTRTEIRPNHRIKLLFIELKSGLFQLPLRLDFPTDFGFIEASGVINMNTASKPLFMNLTDSATERIAKHLENIVRSVKGGQRQLDDAQHKPGHWLEIDHDSITAHSIL